MKRLDFGSLLTIFFYYYFSFGGRLLFTNETNKVPLLLVLKPLLPFSGRREEKKLTFAVHRSWRVGDDGRWETLCCAILCCAILCCAMPCCAMFNNCNETENTILSSRLERLKKRRKEKGKRRY